LPPCGRSGCSPRDGGSEEFAAVFAGASSAASRPASSAIRACAAANWPTSGNSERISASCSKIVSVLRSNSGVTPTLNRTARDRVNPFRNHPPGRAPVTRRIPQGEQL
jgi:hypothetical protein